MINEASVIQLSRAQCGKWKRASHQNAFQAAAIDFEWAPGERASAMARSIEEAV